MQCIEDQKDAKYKCPACESPYCSVVCFKSHKLKCVPADDKNQAKNITAGPVSDLATGSATETADNNEKAIENSNEFSRILENARVQELLSYEGVNVHLALLADLLNDPQLSGEMNSEGRRIVALKKLRELRKGGREANEAIEELVVTVTTLWSDGRGS